MQYDKTFKEEAVRLSDEIGLKNAAAQLGISYYTLSGWRNERNKYGQSASPEVDIKPFQEILMSNAYVILKKRMRSLNDQMRYFSKSHV